MSNPIQDAPIDPLHQKEVICESIRQNSAFTVSSVTMNTLATVVACYGLLQNSTAVVIGAMIIAMLLGPISGIALALVCGDNALLRKGLLAEVGGVLTVLCVAYVIGKIHQDMPLTDQILSRAAPNILDLMIALAGGAAGAYATVSPRLSVGLVGVAIATALVPPLSTCSICLARGETRLAFGGFLLFFANFIAIQFASSVVMFLHGYHRMGKHAVGRRLLARRNAISFGLLIGLASVLSYDFSQSIAKQQFQAHLRARLEQELRAFPGVHLADLRFQLDTNTEIVIAVVRTPFSFSPERVAALEKKLPAPKGLSLELHIRSVITKETTRNGYLHELPQQPNTEDSDVVGQPQ
ncbi:MAG TPA: TIGR00341 family protein [Chthonomonadaceae bacterium]|nr:TIGR00341 family protein [Chthonomonadaceae bacterium]